VLLLEAGPAADALEIHVPAALSRLWRSEYDWNYVTVPQERAADRPIYWPRGRVLGGSSAINAMIYIRGNRLDYDAWRDEYGCVGWGYRELLPYFRRAEARADRFPFRICGTSPNTAGTSSRPPPGAVRWKTTTSTARHKMASASTR
jgi:choline dehydrogenase